MVIHCFNPLEDVRWEPFVNNHPRSSVFHTRAWLTALRKTYGYEPGAFTTASASEPLANAVVVCEIDSWLTGRRLVSLPFADCCDPLLNEGVTPDALLVAFRRELPARNLRYIEIRPTAPLAGDLGPSSTKKYWLHCLDLTPSVDILFRNLHKDSTQRKIRRAEREGLTCETGASEGLLTTFYRLLAMTRRRHALPPQPRSWFENLIEAFGGALEIRVASHRNRPVAGILTLRHKRTLVYKYGCSDAHFHSLGGMHLLLWKAIVDATQAGLRAFDLGRSDWEDTGLVTFKDRWGASRSETLYLRLIKAGNSGGGSAWWGDRQGTRLAESVVPYLPPSILRLAGALLYKHVG